MLSALLESKLEQFADAMGTDPRKSASGMPASQVVRVIRDRLSAYTRDDTEHGFVAGSEAALDSARSVLEHRNQIVHRAWPIAGLGDWKGWKPRRPTVDNIIGENADWRAYTRTDLLDLLPEAEHAVQQVQVQMAACSAFPRR